MCNCNFNGQVITSYELKVPETKTQNIAINNINSIKITNLLNPPIIKSPKKTCTANNPFEVDNNILPAIDKTKSSKRSTLLIKYSMDGSHSQSQSTIEQFSRSQTLQSPIDPNCNRINPENSIKSISNKEEGKVYYYLKCHFLFYHFTSELLKELCTNSKIVSYDKNKTIPIDNMLLIKNGQIEIKGDNKNVVLSIGDTIGESAITTKKDISEFESLFTLTALTNTEVYCISYDDYQLLKSKQIPDENTNDIKEKIDIVNRLYLFKSVASKIKSQFASMIITSKFTEKTIFYSKRKRFKVTAVNELRSQKLMFIIKSGVITLHAMDFTQTYEKGNIIGADQLLFYPNDNTEYEFNTKDEWEGYIIPEKLFIETFGLNYRDLLIHNYFEYVIKKSLPITKMLNGEKSADLFKLFTIKQYKPNEIVISKAAINSNAKYILLLEGELINSKVKNKIFLNKGAFYGDDCINSTEE